MDTATTIGAFGRTKFARTAGLGRQGFLDDYSKIRQRRRPVVSDFVVKSRENSGKSIEVVAKTNESEVEVSTVAPVYVNHQAEATTLKALIRSQEANYSLVASEPTSRTRGRRFLVAGAGVILPLLAVIGSINVLAAGSNKVVEVSSDFGVIQVDKVSNLPTTGSVLSVSSGVHRAENPPVFLSVLNAKSNSRVVPVNEEANLPKEANVIGWLANSAELGSQGTTVLLFKSGSNNGLLEVEQSGVGQILSLKDSGGQSFSYRVTSVKQYEPGKLNIEALASSSQSNLEIVIQPNVWKNTLNQTVISAELV